MLSLGLEIAFAVLLVAAIGYAIILNRKLGNLRQHKDELERLAMNFSQATTRADDGIKRLKSSTSQMKKSIVQAQSLRDDLTLLIERGSLTADRLEEGVRRERSHKNEPKSSVPKKVLGSLDNISKEIAARGSFNADSTKIENKSDADNKHESSNEPKSKVEKDLLEALRQAK